MLASILTYWQMGTWRDPSGPQYKIQDINGNLLSVGDTVTFTGKIALFYYTDPFHAVISVLSNQPDNNQRAMQIDSLCVEKV